MFIPNYPEDSVLRRHYEAAAARLRQHRLSEPPTDSVLRRHFHQLQQLRAMRPSPSARPAAETTHSTKANSASVTEATTVAAERPPHSAKGGGFFSRLKRFFGS